ncbi:MAG: GTPase HflX [Halobacteriovoraceae bacterium]|nr:GTPase HflX [Halobacteriovoraceae bacterium]
MLENDLKITTDVKAAIFSIVSPAMKEYSNIEDSKRSVEELYELLRTLGIEVVADTIQNKKSPEASTILGEGKLIEIAKEAKELGAELLVSDIELTAGQIRNIKKLTGLDVIDRCHVILEIFANHAHTKEAKIQIEIARLEYLLPRLTGLWSHLGRQRGARGTIGGEGEQQIELDRRIVRQRIEHYKEELVEVQKSRKEQNKKRSKTSLTAALVGYTNAGKSSVMNRLCKEEVLEENKLFATLDSTYRTLNPDSKPPMILVDTVGFISNLPNTLIDGFKTTLDSAVLADLLIIVCDISDPHFEKHLDVTQSVLDELEIGKKERLLVFNKKDKLQDKLKEKLILKSYPKSFVVSTFDQSDMKLLRDHIINHFLDKQDHFDLFIPYEDGLSHSKILAKTNVQKSENYEKGVFYRIRIPEFIFGQLNLKKYVLAPEDLEGPLFR